MTSIRRAERGELEAVRIETAFPQHANAGGDGIADGFDPPERKGVGRVDFQRDHLSGQGGTFFQRESVGIAPQGLARIFSGGYGHVCEIVSAQEQDGQYHPI